MRAVGRLVRRSFACKILQSSVDAVEDIRTGSRVAVGGYGPCGVPENSLRALHNLGSYDLTVFTATSGIAGWGLDPLLRAKQVKRLVTSYTGTNASFLRQYYNGEVELVVIPTGSLAARVYAGGAGIPAIYTKTGAGTIIEDGSFPIKYHQGGRSIEILSSGKEKRTFRNKDHLLEEAITTDYSLIKAWKGDTRGNLVFRRTAANFNTVMAMCARVTIAEVEEIVPEGELDPDDIHVPAVYVHRLYKGEYYEKPIEMLTVLAEDNKISSKKIANLPAKLRIAKRAAKELHDGMTVHLGVGIPGLVAHSLDPNLSIMVHAESGALGIGEYPKSGKEDPDIVNTGREACSLVQNASCFSSNEAMDMLRGGHMDVNIIGGFQVSQKGDLANWQIPGKYMAGIGGSMDVVAGHEARTIVTMLHTVEGRHKILKECSLPLTGRRYRYSDTKYTIVRRVARKDMGWRLSRDPFKDDWDVLWTDSAVAVERLASMKKHQKINHFPGMFGISRKDYLARNLNKMKSAFPSDFDYFPKTWLIPSDLFDFKSHQHLTRSGCYIVKPEASSQGKGIYLIRRAEELAPGERCVVQQYIARPYLLDGLKFDLRIYILITSCSPLRLYIHEEGLTRLATEEYQEPRYDNMDEVCMHLTNYAVNKNSEKFEFNTGADGEEKGHKRSLAATFQRLEAEGWDIDEVWRKICDLVVKTMCAIQPSLAHTYKSAQPDDIHSGMCFELLGFDILLDHTLKPWLLEVNHSPSFTADSPLDERVKSAVIGDSLRMLGVSVERRKKLIGDQKLAVQQRNWLSKTISERRMEKKHLAFDAQLLKDEYEKHHLGGFTCIYPVEGGEAYTAYMDAAGKLWESWTCHKSRSAVLEGRTATQDRQRSSGGLRTEGKMREKSIEDRLQVSMKVSQTSESPSFKPVRPRQSRPHTSFHRMFLSHSQMPIVPSTPEKRRFHGLPSRPLH